MSRFWLSAHLGSALLTNSGSLSERSALGAMEADELGHELDDPAETAMAGDGRRWPATAGGEALDGVASEALF